MGLFERGVSAVLAIWSALILFGYNPGGTGTAANANPQRHFTR